MHWGFDKDVTVADLIEIQRRYALSNATFEQVVGTLFVAGVLQKRLNELDDHQIGQLLSDVVGHQLSVSGPEMTICAQATLRLFRSPAETLTSRDIENTRRRTACPMCGNEMLMSYGIDERDYLECTSLSCSYKMLP